MKTVRVYELSVKHESVPEVDRYIDRSYFNPNSNYPFVEKFTDEVASLNVHHERIKIQEFCSTSLPEYLGANCREMSRVQSEYIAMPRDLENLLTVKWQQKLSEKQSQLDMVASSLRITEGNLAIAAKKLEMWWSAPWYKRAWSAIRGQHETTKA